MKQSSDSRVPVAPRSTGLFPCDEQGKIVVLVRGLDDVDDASLRSLATLAPEVWVGYALAQENFAAFGQGGTLQGIRRHHLVADPGGTSSLRRLASAAPALAINRLKPGSGAALRSLLRKDRWVTRVLRDARVVFADSAMSKAIAQVPPGIFSEVQVLEIDRIGDYLQTKQLTQELNETFTRLLAQRRFRATALDRLSELVDGLAEQSVAATNLDPEVLIEFALRLSGHPTYRGLTVLERLTRLENQTLGIALPFVQCALGQCELSLRGVFSQG